MTGPTVGLIMSGGGARAAYQVGVLRAIADMLPQRASNPFGIICGTSAGSVNAASLASDADRFDRAVSRLARTWGTLHIRHVYRANLQGAISNLYRGVAAFVSAGWHGPLPGSLLDCGPLAAMLGRRIDFARIRRTIAGRQAACAVEL
jgi:NTE family protein